MWLYGSETEVHGTRIYYFNERVGKKCDKERDQSFEKTSEIRQKL